MLGVAVEENYVLEMWEVWTKESTVGRRLRQASRVTDDLVAASRLVADPWPGTRNLEPGTNHRIQEEQHNRHHEIPYIHTHIHIHFSVSIRLQLCSNMASP